MPTLRWWVWLAAGVALGAFLWFPRSHVQTPDDDPRWREREDSLRAEHSRDSAAAADRYRIGLAQAADSASRAAAALAGSNRHRARADSLRAVRDTAPPDSALPLALAENAALRVAIDTLTDAYGSLFAAYRGTIEAASAAHVGWMKAEGQLSLERTQWEDEREAWRETVRRMKPRPKWSAGALWEPGGAVPVGGYVARDLGPLVLSVGATDGPGEPATARLGVGVRF